MRALCAHDFPHGGIPAAVSAYTIYNISFLCQRQIIAAASYSPAQHRYIDNVRPTISSDSAVLRERAIKRRGKNIGRAPLSSFAINSPWKWCQKSVLLYFHFDRFRCHSIFPTKHKSQLLLFIYDDGQLKLHLAALCRARSLGSMLQYFMMCAPAMCNYEIWIATTAQHAGLSFK